MLSYKIFVCVLQEGGSIVPYKMEDVKANNIHIAFQVPQYVLMTAGEVMFSVTGLEFSYSQVSGGAFPGTVTVSGIPATSLFLSLLLCRSGSGQHEVGPAGWLAADCCLWKRHRADCCGGGGAWAGTTAHPKWQQMLASLTLCLRNVLAPF